MKILIASDTYYPSVNGASYFTQRLAKILAERDNEVFVMAPSTSFGENIFEKDGTKVYGLRSIGIPVHPDFRISPLWLVQGSIEKYVKEIRPDIIHIQNHFMIGKGLLKVARELDIPIVGTNHFMPDNLVHYFHLPQFAEEKLKKFAWKQFAQIYRQLDAVTTPTKTAAELIEDLDLKKKVIPLSNGIDLKRFNPKNDGEYLKERYKIPENRKIILFVGRLDKEKKIDVVLRAIPIIAESIDAQFVIAGTGAMRGELESLAKKIGFENRVTFAGFVPDEDLPNLYTVADLFVNAGIAELQCLVAMEAMASGLPILAVNALALPELCHDNENGYLFNDEDSPSLAAKAVKILSDEGLREEMGKKSLEIIQNHDIDKIMDMYKFLYEKAIQEHKQKINN